MSIISPCFTSVYGHAETEFTVKKSRFITSAAEISTEEEARSVIGRIRKQYWDARHNCFAYRIGDTGFIQKYDDDGEPAGTAGRPILEVLTKSGITNTVIVITRYFGGIKLGGGGLIRAYSHAAVLGVEAAQIADYFPFIIAEAEFGYAFINSLERILPALKVRIIDRIFSDTVCFRLEIPQEKSVQVQADIADLTNGTAVFKEDGNVLVPIIREK
ncbi:MAG: YigZ family protein [Megasphaera sp.]|jgi:uncharacterized YigZ family protein|nr:YigZ family protein [Megasphaera sp.]MCI1824164.1 YigZ family protein [Megasphaera sp.]